MIVVGGLNRQAVNRCFVILRLHLNIYLQTKIMVLAHNIDEGNRTDDVQIVQNVTFDTMLLTLPTLKGLKENGFYKPSPVQLHGIPLGKCGFDLLLEAKSGTGKTGVFTVITLEKLDLEKELQTLILAPTREIASQICDVLKQIGSYYEGLIVEVVMGGLPVEDDIEKFKKNVHVVVGSPGRLRHLIQDKHIDVSSVRLLVLDEADKLMEKSFQADINYIFSILPAQKQVIMSSATYPDTAKDFISKYVKCAQLVCPDSNCVLLGVEQKITIVKYNTNIVKQTKYRYEELIKILTKRQFKQCLIFCNYQTRVAELYKLLTREKWPVEQLCGQQEQIDRLDALKTLKDYKCRILVSTDLAARGIDASNVDLVINFEPPSEWQTYLHRIGRAGRYGSYGMSITILSEGKEEVKFKAMLDIINLNNSKIGKLWINTENGNNDFTNKSSHVDFHNNLTGLDDFYKDVWKDLISVCVNNRKEKLDEFQTLCKSFEESKKLKIETFTDLVNSFEDSKNNALIKDEYYLKKMPKHKSIKRFFELMKAFKVGYIQLNMEISSGIQEKHNNNVLDVPSNDNQNNELKDVRSNSILRNKTQPKIKEIDKDNEAQLKHQVDNKTREVHKNSKKYLINPVDSTTEYDSDASLSKALIDAGLPTSFGTSKYSKNMKGKNKKGANNSRHTFNEDLQDEYHSIKHLQNDHKPTTSQIIERFSHRNNIKTHKNSSKQGINTQKNIFKFKNTEAAKVIDTNTSSNLHKDKYTEDYKNWYYHLKNRVKQIEMALYIEEFSKL